MPLSGVLDNSQRVGLVGLVGQNQPGLSKVSVLKQTKKVLKHRGTEITEERREAKLRVLCASVFFFRHVIWHPLSVFQKGQP